MDPRGTAYGLAIAAAIIQVSMLPLHWALILPPAVYTYYEYTVSTWLLTASLVFSVAGIASIALARKALASACFFISAALNLLSLYPITTLYIYALASSVLLIVAGVETHSWKSAPPESG